MLEYLSWEHLTKVTANNRPVDAIKGIGPKYKKMLEYSHLCLYNLSQIQGCLFCAHSSAFSLITGHHKKYSKSPFSPLKSHRKSQQSILT